MLIEHIGQLEPHQVHDATLEPFVKARLAAGVNDVAWSIVQKQRRRKHPIWVFPYRGKPINTMNNTAWQDARERAHLKPVRVHDLRHTYGARLRAAAVSEEDRAALLGHAWHSMPDFYASPDITRLISLANRVLERTRILTIVRVVNG